MSPDPPQRILILKPSSLGDIVHALPVLTVIRRKWPESHVAWLVANSFAPLLENHPLIDEVILFDRTRYGRMLTNEAALAAFLRFVGGLRRRRFDLVIDLQGLIRSGFLSLASGARRRIGFRHARECAWLFYSERVRVDPAARHAVDQNLALAAALGLDASIVEFPLALRPDEQERAAALLRSASVAVDSGRTSFIAVIPGARWVTKQWRPERIAALLDRLHTSTPHSCVLLGAPSDRGFSSRIVAVMKSPVVDLVGQTTLRELSAVLSRAALVITHDSGPMHIAAALRKPVVALFGPTDPRRCGPYATDHRIVATPIECSPCYRRTCSHHSCMERLAVETVEAAVREMLGQQSGAAGGRITLPVHT